MPKAKVSTTETRIKAQKEQLLELLTKIPIIQVAVKRVGLSRATFYRWRDEDPDFAMQVATALREGSTSINELAQSKLIEEVSRGNMTALIFWLKSRDPLFSDRRTVINEYQFRTPDRPISPQAAEAIDKVFTLFEGAAQRLREEHDRNIEEELALEATPNGLDSEDE